MLPSRKIFPKLCAAFLMLMATNAGAQSLSLKEASVSVGFFSIQDASVTKNPSRYTASPWSSEVSSPIVALGVLFYESDMLEVGMDAAFQRISYQENYSSNGFVVQDNIERFSGSLAARIQLKWLTTEDNLLKIYSNGCFGLSLITEDHSGRDFLDENFHQPAFHLTVIGLRFGDKVGGFLEMGSGYRGLISGGISFRM